MRPSTLWNRSGPSYVRLSRTVHHAAAAAKIRHDFRSLLRETAQPVAVVTSIMPAALKSPVSHSHPRFHGATLSSFSSIAMDPHPLITFSLRVPSRMATALHMPDTSMQAHLIINVLSAAQADTAVQFSRPDLYPDPFSTARYFLSEDGLPILEGSLGALSCRLVTSPWPLHDLEVLRTRKPKGEAVWEGDGVASELFIAEVTRIERMSSQEDGADDLRTLPLLYHRRSYSTTRDIPLPRTSPAQNKP